MTLIRRSETDTTRYEHLKEGLAHTIVSIPWITGIIVCADIDGVSWLLLTWLTV